MSRPSVRAAPAVSLPPMALAYKRVVARPGTDASGTELPSVRSLLAPVPPVPGRAGEPALGPPAKRKASAKASTDTRRRQQCRTNQQRYRDKQKFGVLRLEADVLQLHQAIKCHEAMRSAVAGSRFGVEGCVSDMVAEFFAMFRFGLSGASLALPIRPHVVQLPRSGLEATGRAATSTLLAPVKADEQIVRSVLPQLAFLRTVFASDVEYGGLQGLDAFVEQLWRYSCYFSNLRLELERVQVQPRRTEHSLRDSVFVLATGSFTLAVSSATFSHVFPRLQHDPSITSRLVGKKLECATEICSEFERRGSRYQCTRINLKLDLLGALRAELGRLDTVAAVLEHALVSPEGAIGDLRGHPTGSSSVVQQ